MSHSRKALAAVAVCAVLWSTGGLFIKVVNWHPFAIAGMRSLIASVFLLFYLKRPRLTFSFPQVAAALCNAATMILFVNATRLTTAANAILLQYSAPIFVAFLGWAILAEKPGLDNWIALAVTSLGMMLFFFDRLSPGSMVGNVLAIASGLTFALFSIFMRMQKSGSPLESFLLSHWLTIIIALPFMFSSPAPGDLIDWAALAALGVFQIGLSSVFFAYGIKHVTAVLAMLVAVIEPILNPVWVFIFAGERPGFFAVVGGLMIVTAVTASSIVSARRLRREETTAVFPPPRSERYVDV